MDIKTNQIVNLITPVCNEAEIILSALFNITSTDKHYIPRDGSVPLYIESDIHEIIGRSFSLSQGLFFNGSMKKDPQLIFLFINSKYYPVSFINDYAKIYNHALTINGTGISVNSKMQKRIVSFANSWIDVIGNQLL